MRRQAVSPQGSFPFGEQWYQSGAGNKWFFTSYDRDSESGLDYALARYYDSRTGTFCSADPLAGDPSDPQSWNRYPYGRNDPIDVTDPSGQHWWNWLLDAAGIAAMIWQPEIDGFLGHLFGAGAAASAKSANFVEPVLHVRDATTISSIAEGAGDAAGAGGTSWSGAFAFSAAAAQAAQATDHPKTPKTANQTICPPVTFTITGVGPHQAPGTTAISQTPRAAIPDGGVAIKPQNFGVTGINSANRSVFNGMTFSVNWDTANPSTFPAGFPTDGRLFPVDNIGPASVRNAPGNMLDVYNYRSTKQARASTRTAQVTTYIPANTAGVTCPK